MALIELQTITRLRAATKTDRYGNTVLDWSVPPTRLDLDHVSVQPGVFDEPEGNGRDPVITGWTIYSDTGYDLDITSADRVEWDGKPCEVVGEVARWYGPLTGALDHVQVTIRRVGG
jgi:hypothetical protein